ncbi:hypothetical protein CLIB1444_09S05116 [[Candida] jaroonii]|uniref:Uncharacterized protein n=1 Tax=[Candida] jaroonii TaxID=467808 RepID=A0ACA9YBS3_9ASCO|nr:hypothetical protein CLIB1444_09S05116 [[Candida] jaroonii]
MKYSFFLLPFFFIFNFSLSIPFESELIAQRDYAVLTEFFAVIEKTGIAVDIIKLLASNKITEPILADAIALFVKTQNLDDLLGAVDRSGLTVDIILRALQDASFFPGLYDIVDGLKTGASTSPSKAAPDTIALATDLAQVASSASQFSSDGLFSVFSEIGGNLGIGDNGGIFSYLSPVLSLVGLSDTRGSSSGSSAISLSPSATAAVASVSGVTVATGTATATGTGTSTPTTGTSKGSSTTKAPSTTSAATSTPTSTSSGSSSSSSGSSWINGLFNTVRGWFSKRDFEETSLSARSLDRRQNEILDNLVDSLAKSGLAMQVIVELIEDNSMHPFMRDLIIRIVKRKSITIDSLKSALDSTNLLNNGVIGALTSPNLGITIS